MNAIKYRLQVEKKNIQLRQNTTREKKETNKTNESSNQPHTQIGCESNHVETYKHTTRHNTGFRSTFLSFYIKKREENETNKSKKKKSLKNIQREEEREKKVYEHCYFDCQEPKLV